MIEMCSRNYMNDIAVYLFVAIATVLIKGKQFVPTIKLNFCIVILHTHIIVLIIDLLCDAMSKIWMILFIIIYNLSSFFFCIHFKIYCWWCEWLFVGTYLTTSLINWANLLPNCSLGWFSFYHRNSHMSMSNRPCANRSTSNIWWQITLQGYVTNAYGVRSS